MSLQGFGLFCLAYVLATCTPGPGIAALVAHILSRGREGLAALIAGFIVGDLIWLTLAAAGMAALAQTAHTLFVMVKYAGVLYLLYLAYRMWTAPALPRTDNAEMTGYKGSLRLFAMALAMTLGSPKVMVFFLALLPTVVDIRGVTAGVFAQIAIAICVILSGVLALYAIAAMWARRFFQDTRAIQRLNRAAGAMMAGTAIAVARG